MWKIPCGSVKTSSIRYSRKKEKKYPTQMNDLVKLEFLLLTTQRTYCWFE